MFPNSRLSRYRQSESLRRFNREVDLLPEHFIQPIFINEGLSSDQSIVELPGISQRTPKSAVIEAKRAADAGVSAVILFGIPAVKDSVGSSAHDPNGVVQTTIRLIRAQVPQLVVIADCCLCEYTDHGHCGIWNASGTWDNDATLTRLAEVAISYAEAGANIVAPSGMIDGMVGAIRRALDSNNHHLVAIMSYAMKYASAFYGPFRHAAGSNTLFKGDRKHHQLAPTQRLEAIREAELDIREGADYLIVKPAQHYMDMIRDLKERENMMIVAYQVSGEYVMIKSAAQQGIVSEMAAFEEVFIGLRRAGASRIIAYNAIETALRLRGDD